MKGVFWNCDGFRDPLKHRFISELTKEQNLSFIAISETIKRSFTESFLRNLCGGRNFIWHTKEPSGHSGGILMGIDMDIYDIGAIDEGDFYVKFILCNKNDCFKWALTVVYGPAQNDRKDAFLTELVQLVSRETLPIVIGGDFNILRCPKDKNKDNFQSRWPFMFNAVIDSLNLKEIEMSGRQFTWANRLPNPTYEKLDRVLVATEWDNKYPLSTVVALNRDISDHTPLLLNTGESNDGAHPHPFKFELGWLLRDGFLDMVKTTWASVTVGNTPLERWQAKIRRVRQYLRGWAKNSSGAYKKEKKDILNKLDFLDKKAEGVGLAVDEIDLKQFLQNKLAHMLREEEIKWYQRAKTKELLQGDSNTKYFHLVASGKHRKSRIYQLRDGDNVIHGEEALRKHITSYYKRLFGPPEETDAGLDESHRQDIP